MKRSMTIMGSVILYSLLLRMILTWHLPVSFFNRGLVLDGLFLTAIFMVVAFIPSLIVQKVFYGLYIVFFTFITVADSIYHQYFFTLIARSNAQGLTLMSPGHAVEYDISIVWYFWVLFACGVLFTVHIARQRTRDSLKAMDLSLLALILCLQVIIAFGFMSPKEEASLDYYRSDAYLFASMHDRILFSERYGYYYYHMIDLLHFPLRADIESSKETLNQYFDQKLNPQPHEYTGAFEGANLIKITVESLDTRFINPIISPTLYHMMNQGYRFDQYYVPVYQQGATCNSEFMAITGLYAINSNAFSNNICDAYADNRFPHALPNQLKKAGYTTYYFHSGYEWFYNRKNIIPQYGFDTVKFQEDLIEKGYQDFNDRLDSMMIHFLDEFVVFEEPFYIDLLTYGLHGAYNHEDYLHHNHIIDQVYDDTLDPNFRVYMQKLHEFDLLLTLIIERLQDEGVYDNTIFVVYTDHYPYMLNQEEYAAFLGFQHGSFERYNQTLIMYHPSMTPTSFSQVGATVDLAPTLLNLIHPEGEFKYFFGNDLLGNHPSVVLLQDLSIIDGVNRMYLRNPYGGDLSRKSYLEDELNNHIRLYELQKLLLEIDYFSLLLP